MDKASSERGGYSIMELNIVAKVTPTYTTPNKTPEAVTVPEGGVLKTI